MIAERTSIFGSDPITKHRLLRAAAAGGTRGRTARPKQGQKTCLRSGREFVDRESGAGPTHTQQPVLPQLAEVLVTVITTGHVRAWHSSSVITTLRIVAPRIAKALGSDEGGTPRWRLFVPASWIKANKNAKRVIMEHQAQPSKDQQVATMGYNPYAYWPYYGRA
ncbi:hypothetical protein ANCCEY_05875 [Ancylostoma ceylanicum]|uniref:Uncharacterized protein n=1 Tax=Ancylostoma ceylanicum TaxID=53326 RepID=A0A0D6LSK9_9BILA|nr:hypothetical protein ANCCEY_05875 [Ancylostoma ceylanicum]